MRAAQEEAATWRPGAPLPLSVRAWLALVDRRKGQAQAAQEVGRKAVLARQEAECLEIARQVKAEGGDAQAVLEALGRAGYAATLAWAEDLAREARA